MSTKGHRSVVTAASAAKMDGREGVGGSLAPLGRDMNRSRAIVATKLAVVTMR